MVIKKSDITLQFEDDEDMKATKEKIKHALATKDEFEGELIKCVLLHKKLLE